MSRSVRQSYPPKQVITLPEEKIVYVIGEGFVVATVEERDTLTEQP
jgi:hypothetical protein